MDRTERFYLIDRLLDEHGLVTRQQFLDALNVSPATFKRDLEYMRDRLHAPIAWNNDINYACRRSMAAPIVWTCTGKICGPPVRMSSGCIRSTHGASAHTTANGSGQRWHGPRP